MYGLRSGHSVDFALGAPSGMALVTYTPEVEALMQAPVPGLAKTTAIRALSKREEQIARLVASGLSNREVAQRLSLSPHTVKNYLFRVFEKLGISTRIELVLYMLSQCKGPQSEQNEIAEMTYRVA